MYTAISSYPIPSTASLIVENSKKGEGAKLNNTGKFEVKKDTEMKVKPENELRNKVFSNPQPITNIGDSIPSCAGFPNYSHVPGVASTITYSTMMMNVIPSEHGKFFLHPNPLFFTPQTMVYNNNVVINPLINPHLHHPSILPGNPQTGSAQDLKNSSVASSEKTDSKPKNQTFNTKQDLYYRNSTPAPEENGANRRTAGPTLKPNPPPQKDTSTKDSSETDNESSLESFPEPEGTPPILPTEPLEEVKNEDAAPNQAKKQNKNPNS